MKHKTVLFAAAVIVSLTNCSTTQQVNQYNTNIERFISDNSLVKIEKQRNFELSRWKPLKADYFILTSQRQDNLLVKVSSGCNGKLFASYITIEDMQDKQLNVDFTRIRVHRSEGSYACKITDMYPINSEQVQEIKALQS